MGSGKSKMAVAKLEMPKYVHKLFMKFRRSNDPVPISSGSNFPMVLVSIQG